MKLLIFYIYTNLVYSQFISPAIINGESASITDFPSALSMQDWNGNHFCGGVMLSPKYVLTAAHCFDTTINGLKMVGGVTSLKSNDAVSSFITRAFVPTAYNNPYLANDIAVVELTNALDLSVATLSDPIPAVGSQFTAVGWGLTTNGGSPSTILQKTTLERLADTSCSAPIIGNIVCTISPTEDSGICNGDSGSGLYNTNGYVSGVLSYGGAQCEVDAPSGYTNAVEYKTFICCYSKNTAVFADGQCSVDLQTCPTAIELVAYPDLIYLFPLIAGVFALCSGVMYAWSAVNNYSLSA